MEQNKKPVIETVKKFSIDDAITEGLWQTGENKYVKIKEIEDVKYLQKILFITQTKRERKAYEFIKQYKKTMDRISSLYIHIIERFLELDKNPVYLENIFFDTIGDEELEKQKEYILQLLKKSKAKIQTKQS
jgi:hypothetical protein